MLTVLFFISVLTSLFWLVYIGLYINGQLSGGDLNSLDAARLAIYAGLTVLPVWIVWQVFGFISQYFRGKVIDNRLLQLFNQMKRNQDYTDLVVRVMLDAEHEIKDGFVINKFDIFIADMNEILADIVQRCNAASSLQLEQLWARVKNGERWMIAKALVEAAKTHSDFAAYLAEKARKDSVFKGTLLEFCARYQNLNALLEKHDRDRVFINIIETGVLGKAYSILAPVIEAMDGLNQEDELASLAEENSEESVSPGILNMEAPKLEEETDSVWRRLNPFRRMRHAENKVNPQMTNNDDDAFFEALQKSMTAPESKRQSYGLATDEEYQEPVEPRFDLQQSSAEDFRVNGCSFGENRLEESDWQEAPDMIYEKTKQTEDLSVKGQDEKISTEEKYSYPFGGWIDENNYQK